MSHVDDKPWVSAFHGQQNHKNPLCIDLIRDHIMIAYYIKVGSLSGRGQYLIDFGIIEEPWI